MVDVDSDFVLPPIEDGLEEGEINVEDEPEEDAPELKHATNVASPNREQVEKHRVGHCPHRSRCKQCIMGRGVGNPHSKSTQESIVPIVGMDYFYITKEGVRRRDELAKELAETLEKASAPAAEALRQGNELGDTKLYPKQGVMAKFLNAFWSAVCRVRTSSLMWCLRKVMTKSTTAPSSL